MLTTAEDVTGHEGGGLGLLKVLIFCVDAYVCKYYNDTISTGCGPGYHQIMFALGLESQALSWCIARVWSLKYFLTLPDIFYDTGWRCFVWICAGKVCILFKRWHVLSCRINAQFPAFWQKHWRYRAANDPSVFTITEKAPTRAFSWLKEPTRAFTFKTKLLRHNAKQVPKHSKIGMPTQLS